MKPLANRLFAPITVATAALVAALSFLLPVAPTVTDVFPAHARTASALVMAVFFCGAALWFWSVLGDFRTRLRVAYSLLIGGMLVFAASMLQVPFFGLFDLWRTAWATGGGAVFSFMLSIVPMYLGMRSLARLAGVKSRFASVWVVSLSAIAAGILAAVISPMFIRHNMVGANIYIAGMWVVATFTCFSAYLAHKSKLALGPSYTRALQAQTIAFAFLSLSCINEATVVTLMPSTTTFYSVYGFYLWTFGIAAALFLRAAYQFHLLTVAYAPEPAGKQASATLSDRDYIDSIVNVANLASRLDDINPILDDMRQITALHPDGSGLTTKEKGQLVKVYDRLEHYLTTSDPLRTFTREQVLDHVTPAFSRLQQPA